MLLAEVSVRRFAPLADLRVSVLKKDSDVQVRALLADQDVLLPIIQQPPALGLNDDAVV
jgi:hypothetical protein